MLRYLSIKNVVLIDELRLELDGGLNVLTGETGAGKSIVLDALGLLLGERFASEMVRQGTTRSEVDGVFDRPTTKAFKDFWESRGFLASDEILIRREGDPDGRSRAFLNDRPVTLTTLQELAPFLVDVHGQNEHQHILKPTVQLQSLDRFAGLDTSSLTDLYRAWRESVEAASSHQLSEQERLQRLDLLRYQWEEIKNAKLQAGEDDDLATRLPELKNAERLRSQADQAVAALSEDEGSVLERLGIVSQIVTSLSQLAPSAAGLLKEFQEMESRLREAARDLQTLAERWQADPGALDAAIGRQDLLAKLKKKYGSTVETIIAHGESLVQEMARLEHADAARRDLETRAEENRAALDKASRSLSIKRHRAAKDLGTAVQKELAALGLKQAIFQVIVEPLKASAATEEATTDVSYSTTGIDRVIFQWAPNPGEGVQPLKNIASGGEMSRVMLALKTVLAQTDEVPTLVFDEVDAGIGGLTAQAVGKKLRALSRHHQVLCVSHLPQIAACAHAHFQVSKQTIKTRTQARVVRLESQDRLEELARLLGSQVTPTSVQHAREMLAQNQ